MTAGRKLAIGVAVVVGITAYMAYVGGAASWQYYLTVDECLANRDAQVGARVRVSGRVSSGSLEMAADRTWARFSLESSSGAGGQLPVIYSGSLPDNMGEEVDVVVEGQLEATGVLRAHKVLTRCASKYESEERPAPDARELKPKAEAVR